MSNLSLREIAQSQLDSTPVIDGQLIVCLDTGNAYRDTATAHVKIGSDLEVVSDLPLAPLAEKLYYLKPDKLYVFLGGNWTLLNDKTIDLDKAIAKLPAESSITLNDDVEIITQDTDITQSHYYRRKLVVLWEYIKTKAQDFFAAKNHQHGKADITDFPTSMPASDVYPWAKAATKPSYTKAEVGLGKVDNTADADKTVKRATTAGTADSANSVAWGNVKNKPATFPVEAHTHDDRYYTEAEVDGKLNSKVNNNEAGANGLLSKLTTSWTAAPTDDTYFIRQDIGGGNQFGRVKFSTIWNYIKGKTDGIYQPKGSYAASEHTHDNRYYTESEMNTKLSKKAENIVLANDANLNSITTPGFYSCGGGNKITNKPNNTDAIGLIVTHNASGSYYTQILTTSSNANTYRRTCLNGTWSGWTQDKYTDTNTWRGIQNNLTSDSTSDSLSAAQGKALKSLVDGKAPKEHTHTKAQITNFPASLKNPTALTIQTNGATAATYDGSAAKTVNITKGNIGLGNVDNTADANKSVKYATSAGSANTAAKATTANSANSLSGLSSRSSQGWGVQTGTFIHGENDSTGGSMAFRRDCPNGGQMSMILDGRFYQNEGQYRVLDTSDEANLDVRSANFAKETYINQYKTVNLTDLDQNTWYPMTGTGIPNKGLRRFKCNVQLNSGSKPSWSTHSGGFTAVVDIFEEASGWGTTTMQGMVLVNDQCYINDSNNPPVGYQQLRNPSIPVWWLRGGGTYFLAADYDCTWTIQKSKYENSGQSVAPTTTYPGVNVNRSTITANLNGHATTAEVATVGVRDYNNANNTIKIGWSGADLDANTLSYVAGYTSDMKIHTASKDGVRSWLGLGASAYKKVQSLSTVGHSDWKNQSTDDGFVPTMAFMTFWNGAYSGSGNSNLQYCDRGRFGTIVTKNSGDYAVAGHTHSFSSITGKPSTYPPSAHNQSWDTITGKPALMESGGYHAETIEALLKQVQGLSPRMGSCSFTKDTHVANTWWNFIYTPHRTGSGDDNPDYGTLLLFPMVDVGSSYIVRAGKDGIVREVRKIYTSGDKPTKGDVGLGNVDNTADANKSVASAAGIKDAGDDRTLTLAYSKDGLAYKNYSWLAGWNGNELRAVDKNQFATAEHGITASGSNYVRFGNGIQICWGYKNESNGGGGTTSFAVAFNNTSYALALTATTASNNAPFITGYTTTGFSYDRHGTAWDDIQWIAVGTWK